MRISRLTRFCAIACITIVPVAAYCTNEVALATSSETTPTATFWTIAGILALFGAFGGVLAALSEVSLQQIREEGIKIFGGEKRLWACVLISGLQGIGGALVFGGLSAFDGKLTIADDSEQKRMVFAFLAVAAGFAGHKFLLLVSRKLTKDVEEAIGKKTDKLRKELAEEEEKRNKLAEAITALTAALSESPTVDQRTARFQPMANEAKKKASIARQHFPTSRQLAILLGRLTVQLEGYDSAAALLSRFIADFKREAQTSTPDFAALLFNRACYKNRKAEQEEAKNAADAERLRGEAWEDLKTSCQIDPPNKDEAKNDPDLASLPNAKERRWENLS